MSLRQALRMLVLMLSGAERLHFFRTAPRYLSSGTAVSNVKVLALELLEPFDSLQLTHSSCAHRSSPVRNSKSTIALSVVLPALTPSSKLSDENNLMPGQLSRAPALPSLLTTAFWSCFLQSPNSRPKTSGLSSKPFVGSSMGCSTSTHLLCILHITLSQVHSHSTRRFCSTAPPRISFRRSLSWIACRLFSGCATTRSMRAIARLAIWRGTIS